MTEMSWLMESSAARRQAVSETVREHRERIALEERERAQRREEQLADQRSDFYSPENRIRAWEKMHALRLPTVAPHPILSVIAHATHLTLEQVYEEQRARRAAQGRVSS
jgi:hypothetical protein